MNHDNFTEVTSVNSPELRYIKPEIAYARGYNECLKRTNAAELLQCLTKAVIELKFVLANQCKVLGLDDKETIYTIENNSLVKEIDNAIKKATDEK